MTLFHVNQELMQELAGRMEEVVDESPDEIQ
jgi:hypothetical protein